MIVWKWPSVDVGVDVDVDVDVDTIILGDINSSECVGWKDGGGLVCGGIKSF